MNCYSLNLAWSSSNSSFLILIIYFNKYVLFIFRSSSFLPLPIILFLIKTNVFDARSDVALQQRYALRSGLPKRCHPRIFLFSDFRCINGSSIGICNKIDIGPGYFSQYRALNIDPGYIESYGIYRFQR